MATAKKAAPKAAVSPKKIAAPAKAKKAVVSKEAKAIAKLTDNIAKLTERKNKISAEINALRDQRTALKAAPAPQIVYRRARAAAIAASASGAISRYPASLGCTPSPESEAGRPPRASTIAP